MPNKDASSPCVVSSTVYVTPRSHFKPIISDGFIGHHQNDENEEIEILFRKEDELNKTKAILNSIREERDSLRRKVKELNDEIKTLKMTNVVHTRRRSVDAIMTSHHGGNGISIARVAGKVKLKQSSANNHNDDGSTERTKQIHGKDFLEKNLSSSVAEQLISTLRESSNIQEIINGSEAVPPKLQKQFEIELERVHCQRDHIKSENNLLQLTLQEIKERHENIQLMFEKCEANNTAYQMALEYSEIGFCLCKILIGKLTMEKHNNNLSKANKVISDEQFYAQLLTCVPTLINSHMSKNIDPHDTLKMVKELTCKLSWDNFSCQSKNERMLSKSIQTTLSKIYAIKNTCTSVKLSTTEEFNSPRINLAKKSSCEIDFETAILLNELAALKKELSEMKWQNARYKEDSKKIKKYGYLSGNATLSAKNKSNEKRNGSPRNRSSRGDSPESSKVMSLADLRISQMTECEIGIELSQALQRENKLESQIESMADTLQRIQTNSENRHAESQKVVDHFKTSYSKLVSNMKQLREKQHVEVCQLKQNIVGMTTHHHHEVSNLKDEILIYERERENKILPNNETAL